ncbi:MAG: 3-hydroxyacyl-CoA dehydrogenase [Chitinophagaceae bacterium]|jgi:3-hydroxybutyryl-CoA dehydrogenase|nr:MAG: 3-hydroxyacyl-CoA dehydrogenase [Chitinophagaceae bacterium]
MRIKVWGSPEGIKELHQKKLENHEIITEDIDPGYMQQCDLFIDLHPDKFYNRLDLYEQFYPIPVLVNCVKDTLAHIYMERFGNKQRFSLYGLNALPTFIGNPVAEVSVLHKGFASSLKKLMEELDWEYVVVEDFVGMITPRTVAMIINEAYFTVQDGTASREDIDMAMKTGVNYPYGPFEWCHKIGVRHVYELLNLLYEATHDERYKVPALLQREYKQDLLELKKQSDWPLY